MGKRQRILESQQVRLVVCLSVNAANIRQIILSWLLSFLYRIYCNLTNHLAAVKFMLIL